ncbi:hypothetical protein GCM10022206_61210 [Streptomyces chiangmaiensis]
MDAAELRGLALEQSPVGAGATEATRRELSECTVADIVRAEATERLQAATQLTAPAHADRVARLRAEVAVLLRLLDGCACRQPTPVTLRDLRVFVDEAAEAVPPDDTRWAIDGRQFGRADTSGHRCPSDR